MHIPESLFVDLTIFGECNNLFLMSNFKLPHRHGEGGLCTSKENLFITVPRAFTIYGVEKSEHFIDLHKMIRLVEVGKHYCPHSITRSQFIRVAGVIAHTAKVHMMSILLISRL